MFSLIHPVEVSLWDGHVKLRGRVVSDILATALVPRALASAVATVVAGVAIPACMRRLDSTRNARY